MTDRYAVIGNPIGHSRSPRIQGAFALASKQDMTYEAILSPLDGFIQKGAGLGQAHRGEADGEAQREGARADNQEDPDLCPQVVACRLDH